jgi:hypothetical protein
MKAFISKALYCFFFCCLLALFARSAACAGFSFSTGDPDGLIGTSAQLSISGASKVETADDFVLEATTNITRSTFTGLLTGGAGTSDISQVLVEIYRVFPTDSDIGRTSGPPTFSTSQVPMRVNSPADNVFYTRDSSTGTLSFAVNTLNSSFTVKNTVLSGGIHPKPNQTTGGDGSMTGVEVQFDITFITPLSLSADHYFFVPQVQLNSGDFLWLSASKPIVPPGIPFPSGFADLQTWIRDENLAPDWLRVGTDIVGGSPSPTFNAAFSLSDRTVPEPSTWMLLGLGLVGAGAYRLREKNII